LIQAYAHAIQIVDCYLSKERLKETEVPAGI
jgi:hypothetical protein